MGNDDEIDIYCLDTSIYINAWNHRYPIDIFPGLWNEIEEMSEYGQIKSPEEVLNEIKKKDDDLSKWIKDHTLSAFEKEVEDIQEIAMDILKDHPRLLDTKKGRSGADVWVIAFAEYYDGIAVSDETKRTNIGKSPKIPDVCESRNVNHMDTIAFIRSVGLSF